jgi:hypothetical protein
MTAASSDRSASSSGCASSIWIIDGTSVLLCTRCSCASSTHAAGSNQRIRIVLLGSVACMAAQATSRPQACASGSGISIVGRPVRADASIVADPHQYRLAWVSGTPLARPVVPPV